MCLQGLQYWFQSLNSIVNSFLITIMYIIYVNNIQNKILLQFTLPGKNQQLDFFSVVSLATLSTTITQASFDFGVVEMLAVSFERCLFLANSIPLEDYKSNEGVTLKESDQIISFNSASFQYRKGMKNILSNLNLKIQKGEKIGIVGRTGAGKSSIILALTKVIEQTEGLLNIQGLNIEDIGIINLRKSFSIIPQDPLTFEGTLRDNLDPVKQYKEQDLVKIMKICQLDKLNTFQNGLQTQITINGGNLSLGEKQIVTLARSLLSERKIILVDEATANIDRPMEELIQQIFKEQFKNATIISIAHKISTIMDSDRIVVVQSGTITENDSPYNLLKNTKSEFAEILKFVQESEL